MIEQEHQRYGLDKWGNGYFAIDKNGAVCLTHPSTGKANIKLDEIIEDLLKADIKFPLLLRFPHIIKARLAELNNAFKLAISELNYQAQFTAVYPIKVNQHSEVVSSLINSSVPVGLEAGSKPELLIVLAQCKANQPIICNGYKDKDYIETALVGSKMGLDVTIVVEKLSELDLVLTVAEQLNIQPKIGIRARLSSIAKGKWQNTGGEKSKFGLSADQIISAVSTLAQLGKLDILQLLHFHMGSQIANIRDIQNGLREGARFYAELKRLGANINYVDVGGGLGIDYEGNSSRSTCSINYTVKEYAHNVVKIFLESCKVNNLPHPTIITEAGRAMTAHHAVLVTNAIDVERSPGSKVAKKPNANAHPALQALWQEFNGLNKDRLLEHYHEAGHYFSEIQTLFVHQALPLEERAQAEAIYFALLNQVYQLLSPNKRAHRELKEKLDYKLSSKYFLNFSVFQSIPDVWAIQQVFPIMPLSRLQEPLTEKAVLLDLTCDSDGRIDHYIDGQNIENTLPLPIYEKQNPFLFGFFLVGAYQEILGDIHNLFGETNVVTVNWNEQSSAFEPSIQTSGDTAEQVLSMVGYYIDEIRHAYSAKLENSPLGAQERQQCQAVLEKGLSQSTYLEKS